MISNCLVRYAALSGLTAALAIATGWGTLRPAIAQVPAPNSPTAPARISQATPPGEGGLLMFDDSGDGVVELQTRLADLGYFDGPITGYFGPMTESSVIAFQQDRGLQADGIVGASTWSALQSSSAPGTPDNLLMFGDTGPAVADLQRRLSTLGFYQGGIDGIFGEATEGAVIALQQSRGLTPDGIVGSATRNALSQNIAATPPARPPVGGPPSTSPPTNFPAPNPTPNLPPNLPQTPAPLPEVLPNPNPIAQLPPPDMEGPYSVLDLQWKLRQQGFYYGPLDGVMGPEMQRSIREAQMDYNLSESDFRY